MMKLCDWHLARLDSRIRGNDGNMQDHGIRQESLPPAEDVKKVQRRLASAEKKVIKNPDGLGDK